MDNDVLVELTDSELDAILGAGDGIARTLTHECNINSLAFFLTCCS